MRTEQWFANGINGRHVLLGLIVFFGVMLLANSLLVYYALDTFSGGDRPDPYRSGELQRDHRRGGTPGCTRLGGRRRLRSIARAA
ncbi:MAG: hypothetical protein R3D01_04450 [Hyphomicrobiales bacterium]